VRVHYIRKHRFTLIELLGVCIILAILTGMLLAAISESREKSRRINCAGNLKCIGLALLMYSGEFEGHFPNNVSNGSNFNVLNQNGYLANGKVYGCPSVVDLRTTADVSNYRYIGSGLFDDNDDPTTNSLAYDASGNHPGNAWMNVLFIDGRAAGVKPGTAGFTND
jgi:prepilin-type processing-associated H-X9-DG protein